MLLSWSYAPARFWDIRVLYWETRYSTWDPKFHLCRRPFNTIDQIIHGSSSNAIFVPTSAKKLAPVVHCGHPGSILAVVAVVVVFSLVTGLFLFHSHDLLFPILSSSLVAFVPGACGLCHRQGWHLMIVLLCRRHCHRQVRRRRSPSLWKYPPRF
jgi:hypothetical protein